MPPKDGKDGKDSRDAAKERPAPPLASWVGSPVSVITNDGRHVVGSLAGTDGVTNLVLTEAEERIYSWDAGVRVVPLGVFVLRGDNCAVVGTVDRAALPSEPRALDAVRAEPLKPVTH